MSHKQGWNVENSDTGELVSQANPVQYGDPPLWYNTEVEAMTAATYFTTITGTSHVVAGPHPRPHA